MKPRTVILTVEVETDQKIADLKKLPTAAFAPWPDVTVVQVQANVAK